MKEVGKLNSSFITTIYFELLVIVYLYFRNRIKTVDIYIKFYLFKGERYVVTKESKRKMYIFNN